MLIYYLGQGSTFKVATKYSDTNQTIWMKNGSNHAFCPVFVPSKLAVFDAVADQVRVDTSGIVAIIFTLKNI